jgi:2'-5' RNA ligase
MAYAVSAWFDPDLERRVRGVWGELYAHGVASTFHVGPYRPHVTLGISEMVDRERLGDALRSTVRRFEPLPSVLSSVCFFTGARPTVYLGITPRAELLDLHAAVHELLGAHGSGPVVYYLPGRWNPHCSLISGAEAVDRAAALTQLAELELPFRGTIDRLGLIDTPAEIELDVFPFGGAR